MTESKRHRSFSASAVGLVAVAAVVGAGLTAWIAKPDSAHPTTQALLRENSAREKESIADRKLKELRTEPKSPPGLPEERPRIDDASRLTPPTLEEARATRLSKAPRHAAIAKLGVDALVPELDCKPLGAMVKDGRSGPGGLGCIHVRKDGVMIRRGHWAHRLENGQLEAGEYEHGLRTGTWERYSAQGALLERGEYRRGERIGAWDEYAEDGQHLAHRMYEDGAFHGASVLYHRQEPTIEVWNKGELVSTETGFAKNTMARLDDESGSTPEVEQEGTQP